MRLLTRSESDRERCDKEWERTRDRLSPFDRPLFYRGLERKDQGGREACDP